jgi:hypothetical protein
LTGAHPIKPTSTSRLSAWRPNLGRRSTYRCGDFVQTTGASSARLIKLKDIKPYLEYYILELVGQGRCHNSSEFGEQVARYLTYFGYGRVITMAKNMGHRFSDVKQPQAKQR